MIDDAFQDTIVSTIISSCLITCYAYKRTHYFFNTKFSISQYNQLSSHSTCRLLFLLLCSISILCLSLSASVSIFLCSSLSTTGWGFSIFLGFDSRITSSLLGSSCFYCPLWTFSILGSAFYEVVWAARVKHSSQGQTDLYSPKIIIFS